MKCELTLAVGYIALVTLWIYAVANRAETGTTLVEFTVLGMAIAQIAFGFVIGRWWALLLPLAAVPISVPAGIPEPSASDPTAEPLPIWFGMIYAAAFAVLFVLVGVVAKKIVAWRACQA